MFEDLINNISSENKLYSKELVLVTKILNPELVDKTDKEIYISEFIVAKIFGYIANLPGHPEVSKNFFLDLPNLLNEPHKILFDKNDPQKRFIICGEPKHRVVLEIRRHGNKTEVNTIHRIRESTLQKLESRCSIL